jgi:hypothetical protein
MRHLIFLVLVVTLADVGAQQLRVPVSVGAGTPQVPPGASNVGVELKLPLKDVEYIEVLRLGRSASDRPWQVADVVRRRIANGSVSLYAPAGLETLLVFRVPDEDGYILDGPFRWPHRFAVYTVPVRWRRTVRGSWPRNGAAAPVWVSADLHSDSTEPWPQCAWWADEAWECIGVPLDAAGVVVSSARDVIFAAALPGRAPGGVEHTTASAVPWARLIAASATGNPAERLSNVAMAVRKVEVPRARPNAVRVQAVADPSVRIQRLSGAAFWITGRVVHPDAWMEVTADGRAPVRVPLREVAAAPAEYVLRADMDPAVSLFGRIVGSPMVPAPGTIVSVFRLVPDPVMPEKRPPRHLFLGEQTTKEDGTFRFDGLGLEQYELLAMHPSLGRAERLVEPDGQEIEVPLQRPVQAVGRVLRGGAPAANVPVRVVPDLAEFAAADDITDVAAGEAQTGADGRFAIALSGPGGGELRIGGDADAVKRLTLARADPKLRVVNVGDVELGDGMSVTFVLEASDGCNLMLAGPEGRAGLTVVRATRLGPALFEARLPEPGRWMLVAACGGRERSVVPGVVDVQASTTETHYRLSWPR